MLYDGHIQHIQTHTNVMLCTDYNMSWAVIILLLWIRFFFIVSCLSRAQTSSHVHKVMESACVNRIWKKRRRINKYITQNKIKKRNNHGKYQTLHKRPLTANSFNNNQALVVSALIPSVDKKTEKENAIHSIAL
eukprot:595598_1